MSNTPNFDLKIKTILDATVPGERVCVASGNQWTMTEKEIQWYKDFFVPPSPYAPETRMKLFGAAWAGFSWWWNKDATTGKKILTHVHPHSGFKVVSDKEWFSSDYTNMGVVYDFGQGFFNQFLQLVKTVPFSVSKNFTPPHNSIARASFGDENSYFVVATKSKRCAYMENVTDAEDTVEAVLSNNIFQSQNICHSHRISNCYWIRQSYDCMNCWFMFDCRNCEHCFGAWNKRYKKYLWFNEQLTQEEWETRFAQVNTCSRSVMNEHEAKFRDVLNSQAVWPNGFITNCQNSSGDYLDKCIDCYKCWGSENAKDEWYSIWSQSGAEHNAFGLFPGSNNCYESPAAINCKQAYFSYFVSQCQNVEYCIECSECENCFGCTNIRHKNFCILNKQYSEVEYWALLDHIKCDMLERGEYGKYFSGAFTCVPHDSSNGRTIFSDWAEKEKQELSIQSYDHGLNGAFGDWEGKTFEDLNFVPDAVDTIETESFSKHVFQDPELYNRPFTYHPLELELYKKLKTPIPAKHFISRVWNLWFELNLDEYQSGICALCKKEVEYAKNRLYPDRKIFCQKCYIKYLETNG
ncbi:MAG: hypothetical protein ABIH21_04540 [Patescibacteria group bacterium]